MGFSDDLKAFWEWTNRPEEFRNECVRWHSQYQAVSSKHSALASSAQKAAKQSMRNAKSVVFGMPVWTDECVRFICEWAKENPGQRHGTVANWKGCFKAGRRILDCENAKAISTQFSSVKRPHHKQHWIYKEVFGV